MILSDVIWLIGSAGNKNITTKPAEAIDLRVLYKSKGAYWLHHNRSRLKQKPVGIEPGVEISHPEQKPGQLRPKSTGVCASWRGQQHRESAPGCARCRTDWAGAAQNQPGELLQHHTYCNLPSADTATSPQHCSDSWPSRVAAKTVNGSTV